MRRRLRRSAEWAALIDLDPASRERVPHLYPPQAQPAAGPRRRPTRARRVVAAGVLITALSGGVAWALTHTVERPTERRVVRCYLDTEWGSERSTDVMPLTGPDAAEQARPLCEAFWQQGFLRAGLSEMDLSPDAKEYPVPPLFVCVLPNGSAGIFPQLPGGGQSCSELGLPEADWTPARP